MSGPSSPDLVSFVYQINNRNVIVTFDASVSEMHQGAADITEHPVETGTNITDNIRPLPRKLSIDAVVTNTPVYVNILSPTSVQAGDPNSEIPATNFQSGINSSREITTPKGKALGFRDRFDRVKDVYSALVLAYQSGARMDVLTTLDTYKSFAISSINIPRSAEYSNAIRLSIELKEVLTVDVAEITSLAAKHIAKKVGPKPTKAPNAQQEAQVKKSAAKVLLNRLTAAVGG